MENKQTATQKHASGRMAAWLIVLAGIPVLILLTEAWCRLCIWLLSLIKPHLSGFWADLFDDTVDGLGIVPIATAAIMWLSGAWFAKRAEKLIPTRRGLRYFVAAGCSFVLAGLCLYWLLRARLPFRLPFEPNANVMINVILALGVYGTAMIRAVFAMRKERKKLAQPPEHITVFCYTKRNGSAYGADPQPETREKLTPFCYITGGAALVNEHGSLALSGRQGKLDLQYFFRIKDYVYREERVPEQQNWSAVYVFDGYVVQGRAICPDLFQVFPDRDQWNYADLLSSPLFDKKPAGFQLGVEGSSRSDLKYSRHYLMDAEGNVTPAFHGKTPRQSLEALQAEQKAWAKQQTEKQTAQREIQNPQSARTSTAPKPAAVPAAAPAKQSAAPKAASRPAAKQPKKALIHVVLDSSLTQAERETVVQAVEHTRQVFPGCSLELTGQGKSAAAEGIRKNMDAYLEGARQENGRYDASQILRRMESLAQYKKEAAAILLFTGRDLCLSSQGASWCFGAGNRDRHTAVCSLFRFRELTEPERLRCVRRTLRHEIGHALGLAMDPKRADTEKRFGLHCTAPGCSMRQTENLTKLLRFSQEEEQQGSWFCRSCLAELEAALAQAEKSK